VEGQKEVLARAYRGWLELVVLEGKRKQEMDKVMRQEYEKRASVVGKLG